MSQSTIVDDSLTIRKIPAVNSRINPCLIRFCYFLGNYLVLPAFFSKITVTGQENIPLTGGVILAPTHRSRWDALILPYAVGRLVTRRDLRFMVSANEMKGVQGWFIRRLGGFPVNTDHPGMGSSYNQPYPGWGSEATVNIGQGINVLDYQQNSLKRETVRLTKTLSDRLKLLHEDQSP